jgi:hypothetical protein
MSVFIKWVENNGCFLLRSKRRMIVKFEGKGCKGCPFYMVKYSGAAFDLGRWEVLRAYCVLHGEVDQETDKQIEIELGKDFKRRGDCPFIKGDKIEVIND